MPDDDAEPESEYDEFLRAVARAPEKSLEPLESNLAVGTVVAGKLRVVRALGSGGMGKVYEVEHVLTRHRRALKVLHPGASANVIERFVREATAAARIGNAHVAETFDAGRLESGEPYLLMELLEGETLKERLMRAGPLRPSDLADLVRQACDGVQAAHEAGIIHRDLKPDNLFVTIRDGRAFVKILDFGISKFDEGRTGAPGITKEGATLGTPFYMSPEQVRGAATDARVDVYALGVILYECASGAKPFEAPFVEQLAILIHEAKPVPLEERAPAVPSAFCEVVRSAMAAHPGRRYESARALGDALGPFCDRTIVLSPSTGGVDPRPAELSPAVTPSTERVLRSPRRSRALAAIGVGGLVLGSALAFVLRAAREPVAPGLVSGGGFAAVSAVPRDAAPAMVVLAPVASGWDDSKPVGEPLLVPDAAVPVPSGSTRSTAHPSGAASPSRADQKGLARENPFR